MVNWAMVTAKVEKKKRRTRNFIFKIFVVAIVVAGNSRSSCDNTNGTNGATNKQW
jgi:hypothetical protein